MRAGMVGMVSMVDDVRYWHLLSNRGWLVNYDHFLRLLVFIRITTAARR